MLKDKFDDLLAFLKDKKILIATHDLVDIDGLVSCYGLNFSLTNILNTKKYFCIFQKFQNQPKTSLRILI